MEQIGGAEAVWITGSPVVEAATTQALFKTLRLILPAIFVLVIALLAVAFRSARATLCASLTIAAGLLWTLADFAILDIPINMVTAIVPPLLITLGLAYSVHLLSEFFDPDAPTNESPQQAVLRTWQRSGPPLLLTGATTVAGLLALLINPLPAVRQFAVLSSLGVAATVGFVLLLLPSLLVLCRCRSHRATSVRWFAGIADKLAAFDTQHRRHIAVVAIVGVLVAIWSASDIRVGTEYIRSFSPQSTVRVDFEAINEQFGGATLVSILIETHVDDALTNPELMAELENFQQWLKQQRQQQVDHEQRQRYGDELARGDVIHRPRGQHRAAGDRGKQWRRQRLHLLLDAAHELADADRAIHIDPCIQQRRAKAAVDHPVDLLAAAID